MGGNAENLQHTPSSGKQRRRGRRRNSLQVPSLVEEHSTDVDQNSSTTIVGSQWQTSLFTKQNLPFMRSENTIGLWEQIESNRVFQKIPQEPHFKPLEHTMEDLREGMAIGYMVAFAGSVEKAYRLRVNDPKSAIDEIIETLAELERYGFDVGIVRDRLIKLLALKEKREKLLDEERILNKRILEHSNVKARVEDEIGEFREKIRKLQEKLSVAQSALGEEEAVIASLQAGVHEIEQDLETVCSEFEGIISSIL